MSGLVAVLCAILCFGIPAYCDSDYDPIQIATEYTAKFREAARRLNASGETAVNEESVQTVGINFNCDLSHAKEPTSIHNLSPKFVGAVAAMGDSVTAGFGAGAYTIVDDLIEFRGLSWSVGGDKTLEQVATFANLIRKFNPEVKGYSTGKHIPLLTTKVKLNVAVSGARTRAMPGQAEVLVKQLKKELGDEVDETWKVITIWIGGNDVCAIKNGDDAESLAADYVNNIKEALDYLKENVKRAIVNVVLLIDVSDLKVVQGPTCSIVHQLACSSILSTDDTGPIVSKACHLYNTKLNELINNGETYERDDFTVMLQPFFSETEVPKKDGKADKSYFAPDCFHFSQKGHAAGATFLWNNMFEAVGDKTDRIEWSEEFSPDCPKDYPYFATYKNSRERLSGNLLTSNNDDHQATSLVAILVGTGAGVVIVALVTIVVAVVVTKLHRRKRINGSQEPTEKMQLIFYKN